MAFSTSKYESDEGNIHPIRIKTERLAAAGTAPTGAITSNAYAKISKTNREFGIRPRGVRLARTLGTAPLTFKRYAFVPVLTGEVWDGAAYDPGETLAVDGVDWQVVARVPEDF
jgi:hypothetical protein